MKRTFETILAAVAVAVIFGAGVFVGQHTLHPSPTPPDTIRVCHIETLVMERPVERLRTIVRHDTVWLAADNSTINNKVWSADTLLRRLNLCGGGKWLPRPLGLTGVAAPREPHHSTHAPPFVTARGYQRRATSGHLPHPRRLAYGHRFRHWHRHNPRPAPR